MPGFSRIPPSQDSPTAPRRRLSSGSRSAGGRLLARHAADRLELAEAAACAILWTRWPALTDARRMTKGRYSSLGRWIKEWLAFDLRKLYETKQLCVCFSLAISARSDR